MPKNWPPIISVILQQVLVMTVFALFLWFLPDNYIEKAAPGRCQLDYQQLSSSPVNKVVGEFSHLKFNAGAHKFKLQNTSCETFREPVLVIETIWLDKVSVTQTALNSTHLTLQQDNLGGRFYSYSLNNSVKDIEVEMTPIMDLRLNFSIWEKHEYQAAVYKLNLYFAVIFSAFITLFIINFLIYMQSRDADYFLYLPFLISNILFLAVSEGVFQSFGWIPEESIVAPLWWLAALSGYFGIRFIMSFSGMDKFYPRFTKYAIHYPSYFYLIGAVLTIFDLIAGSLIIRITILWLTIVPWLALLRMLKANTFGTIYIFGAWTALIVGVAARTLYGLELIELSRLVIYGIVLGSLMETLLLSLALGYKIVQFRDGQQFRLEQAMTDALTELPNRRYLDEAGEEIFLEFKDKQHSVAVAIIDCDRFKNINDNYGHEVGDYVLKVISRKIRTALRSHDIVGRWGGEEFLCILPDVTQETLDIIMARLLDSISENNIQIEEQSIHTTVSVGLTLITSDDTSINDSIRRADQALYKAKQAGRAQLISA